ncbi:MAG: tRNA uridine-5-carboxymethylaminomethyl(34) synthesis GTPase MnmE [Alphaproteobacteria bacterium]|nr:MAG: tRNA uridine-5-carboxymethylaminomethyl(34) synthesis GTPase MnmE [Alphaproteobacteria bacterium]
MSALNPRPDTIYALSSAPGRAGVAVIRVSGPCAQVSLSALRAGRAVPQPRRAVLTDFTDPASGAILDKGLALWFPAPHSFTGEDVAELHVHGGRAVLAAIFGALSSMPGLRPAEPGEFTRRAFDHGRLDLTEVEGLADLIAAETEAQRRQALRQMEGGLSELVESWRRQVIALLAQVEAGLDFPDEDDAADLIFPAQAVGALRDSMAAYLKSGTTRGQLIRQGARVVLLGPPNVGKSSLLNALSRKEAAIVSPVPGTTRDAIEVPLDLGGYPVILTDTAGLRAEGDAIEQEGMRRALDHADRADLVLRLMDPLAPEAPLTAGNGLIVVTKRDIGPPDPPLHGPHVHYVSAVTGAGLDDLTSAIVAHIKQAAETGLAQESPVLTRHRHRLALQDAIEGLTRSLSAPAAELAAEDLRLSARALERLIGRIDVEDILDAVFREFCIGK